jgi:glutamate dehydrogenase
MDSKANDQQSLCMKKLDSAIVQETERFKKCFLWLENSMPPNFFKDVPEDHIMLITHMLIGFIEQNCFTKIQIQRISYVICIDSTTADTRILEDYHMYGIKNYRTYISNSPPPFPGMKKNIRIATVHFTEANEKVESPLDKESKEELRKLVKKRYLDLTSDEFEHLMKGMNTRFLDSLSQERLVLALDMLFRAKTRDHCQYEVRYNEDWKERNQPSMQIVLAWRNTPKHKFLYKLACVVERHGLIMQKVNTTYINPYSRRSILVMSLGIHGANNEAVWDVADIPDFLRELVTLKYFSEDDRIDEVFIQNSLISGNQGNLLRAMVNIIHQLLVSIDPNLYTIENVEESLCRHQELSIHLCKLFGLRFSPEHNDSKKYEEEKQILISLINKLDTGHPVNDLRRKNILLQGVNFVDFTQKTNFYRNNKSALSFRIDPKILDHTPSNREDLFPELPYAIFYFKGMHFFGFHIRFQDLSRGGLRTIYPREREGMVVERNTVFSECYNLAYTQEKKNKDIPEGGSKGVIFIRPFEQITLEASILRQELEASDTPNEEINEKIQNFKNEQRLEFMHQGQRAYVESLLTLVNCEENGTLRAKHIIDYWSRPEYIYLGPDENMHDPMILWIAEFSKKNHYKPLGAFISSKPNVGINHKEYGVTSLGVHVFAHEVLKYLGINPEKEVFTVKMSGGPDGDVAGNEIVNLHKYYPKTAKLIALTDGSGTINDPNGLNLECLCELFKEEKPIKFYPPERLSEGGFLLDKNEKRTVTAYSEQTLCWRKVNGKLVEDWVSGSDMNKLYSDNVHKTKADLFIPAGGRPKTLNDNNYTDFLDENAEPTAKAIVEGANLYLTPGARRRFEELGVIVIKDSSANKGGVICSSFEVLCSLILDEKTFLEKKNVIVEEILERLKEYAQNEVNLMLDTHKKGGVYLTDISEKVSENINKYTYELLKYLEDIDLSNDPSDPLVKSFLDYCLPTLRNEFSEKALSTIPDHHKKAIISCQVAANTVYRNGIEWSPSIVDILPLLLSK